MEGEPSCIKGNKSVSPQGEEVAPRSPQLLGLGVGAQSGSDPRCSLSSHGSMHTSFYWMSHHKPTGDFLTSWGTPVSLLRWGLQDFYCPRWGGLRSIAGLGLGEAWWGG